MKLPNCEQAEIPDRKLTVYLLHAKHPQITKAKHLLT